MFKDNKNRAKHEDNIKQAVADMGALLVLQAVSRCINDSLAKFSLTKNERALARLDYAADFTRIQSELNLEDK
jgi:hypothetical protein